MFSERYLKAGGKEGTRNQSRLRKREAAIWQPRYWERQIRDDEDFEKHFDTIHFNPVKTCACTPATGLEVDELSPIPPSRSLPRRLGLHGVRFSIKGHVRGIGGSTKLTHPTDWRQLREEQASLALEKVIGFIISMRMVPEKLPLLEGFPKYLLFLLGGKAISKTLGTTGGI